MKSSRLAVAVAMSFSLCAFAADVRRGDVFRTATMQFIMCPTPPIGALYSRTLDFKDYAETGDAIAFDGLGNLYSVELMTTFITVDPMLQPIRRVPLPEVSSSITVDSAGFAYILGESGTMYVYSPAGMFQRSFTLPNLFLPARNVSIDIGNDGCTLFYVGVAGAASRFNACSGVALPALVPNERFLAIRALADGGFVASTGNELHFYDSSGHLAAQISLPNTDHIATLAFDLDPDYLWIGTEDQLLRMNIRDHSIAAKTNLIEPHHVAVYGETRPSAAIFPPAKRHGTRH
jgi:hypothetical protein